MSSEHNKPDDAELDEFLAGRSRIGAAYREASKQDGAPPELDAAILSMAREAVATPVRRRSRWIQPMALAATLALSLGVLLNIWRDPVARQQVAPEADSRFDDAAAPVDGPVTESLVPAESKQKNELAKEPERATDVMKQRRFEDDAAMPYKKLNEPLALEAPPAPPPPPPAASMQEREEALSAKPASPEGRAQKSEQEAPAAAAGSMAPQMERKSMRPEPSVERDRTREFSAPSAPAAAAAPSGANADTSADSVENISPAQWIERVRARLAQGDEEGARLALRSLREAYPAYVLPDDLRRYADAPGETP